MHENRHLFLFLIEINNMHCTRRFSPVLPKPVSLKPDSSKRQP